MAADATPTAAEVLDRFTAVTGGEAAYRAVKTQYVESTVDFAPMGTWNLKVWKTAKGDSRIVTIPPNGKEEQVGVYKNNAWSLDASGAKLLTGIKRAEALHDAVLFPHELWRDHFAKAEYLGVDVLRGSERCHKIRLTPKAADLKPETFWFSAKSGLLIKMQDWEVDDEDSTWTAMTIWLSNYRKMPNGLLVPQRTETDLGNTKLIVVFDRMVFDSTFSDRDLRYPAAIENFLH